MDYFNFIGKNPNTYALGFLFCSNPCDKRSPDLDYQVEYSIIKDTKYSVYLFSLEDLLDYNRVPKLPQNSYKTMLIYRGWILSPEKYQTLYDNLLSQGYVLINDFNQYINCHLLPNWYEKVINYTPYSEWTTNLDDTSIIEILSHFGKSPLIVKDYVKSRKHEWHEACYIENAFEIESSLKIIHTFLERQEPLTGGLVLRKYIELLPIGYHEKSNLRLSREYRVFYLFGKVLCIIDYWGRLSNSIDFNTNEYQWVQSFGDIFDSNFFTIDFARKIDGSLIVIEIGDGQVSGLQGFNEKIFYSKLISILA